jgi:nicotinamidase/pyrazinamidase
MTNTIELLSTDALIVVDPQLDFCPGGALAVTDGDEVMPLIVNLMGRFDTAGATIVFTQDWHTQDQVSFASNHGVAPFTDIEVSYGTQTTWPDHCLQGSTGADFHPSLNMNKVDLIIRKGAHPTIDSYSAFNENDRTTSTGLAGLLRDRGITRVFLVGLAYDFCVGYSALDAVTEGFDVIILKDATRAIDLNGSVAIMEEQFTLAGVQLVDNLNPYNG